MIMEQYTNINQNENEQQQAKKPLYSPFIVEEVDPSVMALMKSAEAKEYYVLYYNREYEENKWAKFIGRYDAYFGIKRILDSESVNIREAIVIVETVGVDPSTKKGKKYLNHPDNCSTILEFCHYVEKFFGDNAYNIDEYDDGPVDDPEESALTITASNTTPLGISQSTFIPQTEAAALALEVFKETKNKELGYNYRPIIDDAQGKEI